MECRASRSCWSPNGLFCVINRDRSGDRHIELAASLHTINISTNFDPSEIQPRISFFSSLKTRAAQRGRHSLVV